MIRTPRRSRAPQVNLLNPPPAAVRFAFYGGLARLVLVAFGIAIWAAVGVGLALVLGWRPGPGP